MRLTFTYKQGAYFVNQPGYDGGEVVTVDEVEELEAENARLRQALVFITRQGGNLPDEHLTDRTGSNDAAARGLMYCAARQIARDALALKSAAGAGLRWSGEMPTEAGWYWWRIGPDGKGILTEIIDHPHGLYTKGVGDLIPVDELDGQWAGPIPRPERD